MPAFVYVHVFDIDSGKRYIKAYKRIEDGVHYAKSINTYCRNIIITVTMYDRIYYVISTVFLSNGYRPAQI